MRDELWGGHRQDGVEIDMMRGQAVPAFIAALVHGGVDPQAIEAAISHVSSLRLGQSITGDDPLVRAFAFEQAGRLERIVAGEESS